jgi:hypothetical protein
MLERHLAQLYHEHEVMPVVRRGRASAYPSRRTVYVPPATDRFMYLLNLHELGHVVLRDRGLKLKRLQREAWAWDYAIATSIAAVGLVERQRIAANLLRYLLTAEQKGYAIPDEDEPFWELLYWWLPYATRL